MDSSDLDPHILHGAMSQPPHTAFFAGLTNVTNRHTDRQTTLLLYLYLSLQC